VWASGLGITAGRFVLAADPDGPAMRMTAVAPDGSVADMTLSW
jgi:hypothetical protein